jgi:hypothetical protein
MAIESSDVLRRTGHGTLRVTVDDLKVQYANVIVTQTKQNGTSQVRSESNRAMLQLG